MDGLDSGVITGHYGKDPKQRPLSLPQSLPLSLPLSLSLHSVSSPLLCLSTLLFLHNFSILPDFFNFFFLILTFLLLCSARCLFLYHSPFLAPHYLSVSVPCYHLFSILPPSCSYPFLHCSPTKSLPVSPAPPPISPPSPTPSLTSVSVAPVHGVECQHPPPHYQQHTALRLPTSPTSVAFCTADWPEPLSLLQWTKTRHHQIDSRTVGLFIVCLGMCVCMSIWGFVHTCGYICASVYFCMRVSEFGPA